MSVSAAFWLALAVAGLIQILVMRGVVPIVARGAENDWDNAIAYVLVNGLLVYYPVRYLVAADSLYIALLAIPLCAVAQVVALRTLYELRTPGAASLGIVHGLVSATITVGLTVIGGVIAAYVLYGKVIADPMRAIRFLLRLIGVELPF